MVNSAHNAGTAPNDFSGFQRYWLAETVRLRESQWGPLQDSNEMRRVLGQPGTFSHRLLVRAKLLGQREGMDTSIRQWSSGAKLAFFVLLILAILTGATAAFGALGDGTRQVNLVLALVTLLGLHIITFLFWGISSILPSGDTHASLGELWLWLTRKLARGPQAVLIPRALVGMLARQGALRPLLGSISHALWLCVLTTMLLTLVALLSARRYQFSWETTLLSPETFVWLTQGLGWLPAKLGFMIPTETIIRASDGLQTLPDTAHALWSSWLIGCLVCYGLLPRAVALILTTLTTLHRIKKLSLDTGLPGYVELRDRLQPSSLAGDIDAPAPGHLALHPQKYTPVLATARQAIVGLELANDQPWPPAQLASHIADLGVIDDRHERQRLLDALYASPPQQLLIVCDGNQTPDRGTLTLIMELTQLAAQTHVTLITPGSASPAAVRLKTWKDHLHQGGLATEHVHADLADALAWLSTPDAEHPQPPSHHDD